NEVIVAVDLVTVAVFIVFGLPSVIASGALAGWLSGIPAALSTGNLGIPGANYSTLVTALSLATVSYIGIESISQAAEETKNPARVIPRATKGAIVAVVSVAITFSILAVTLAPTPVSQDPSSPAHTLASFIPVIGPYFAIWVGVMGTLVCYVSTNTGVIGVSRVTFSMSRLGLLPKEFNRISRRFRTPYLTLLIFTAAASLLLAAGVELSTFEIIPLVASVYNFGALIAYFYVNAAAIVLRLKEPTNGGWKMPLNITVHRGGKPYQVSVIPFIGIAFTAMIWLILVLNSPGGRVAGAVWFAIGIAGYLIYQRWKRGRKPDA
ncbi:MAG: amino acid permease, partial [Nitrososphaerota archaeon]|nr:amino acid permease [Nitrososphaerota archaeon]